MGIRWTGGVGAGVGWVEHGTGAHAGEESWCCGSKGVCH